MFKKILIANRGEIACRVIETARRMGIQTVAVYSQADQNARHVRLADQAIAIGPAAAIDSYLRIDAIIEAATISGAQAIHPGYGFLSENAEFVEACDRAGITFIGPSADAIRSMGLKDAAKALMERAGVPVVPGYHGANQEADALHKQAVKIGYPVLIKAVAGGGGKGMRLVENDQGFQSALISARSEAISAFGNGDVLVEKFIKNPRHVEFQIFGDGQTAVHLFERDCSLQRRHQKVIEEAPAPGMTPEVRAVMGAAAVRAAKTIGYSGAGTVEFIVDGSGPFKKDGFWFMEMNTRLQVEHPVTEAITGVDLVEWQLRVAAGQDLPLQQGDIQMSGHAIEARLYAEDVDAGFLPATGTLNYLQFPENIRVDSGVEEGDEISAFYDPMIAKITAFEKDREIALGALRRALAMTDVGGTTTNRDFLVRLCDHDAFRRANIDTGFIDKAFASLVRQKPASAADFARAAIISVEPKLMCQAISGFAIWSRIRNEIVLETDGETKVVLLTPKGLGHVEMRVEESQFDAHYNGDKWSIDGSVVRGAKVAGQIFVFGDTSLTFRQHDPLEARSRALDTSNTIVAPMPGLVRSVGVEIGQQVTAGTEIAVLEAMKMEHSLRAPRDATIAEVYVSAGDQILADTTLVALEPES